MKTGEAAKRIGVDRSTITNWIDHPLLSRFFSSEATNSREQSHRELSFEDMDVLNTINYLRNVENIPEWEDISDYLDTGRRHTEYPVSGRSLDTKTVTVDEAQQLANAKAVLAERDAAIQQIDELRNQIEALKSEHKEALEQTRKEYKSEIDKLQIEVRQLLREIGRLEGQLESQSKE